MAGHIQAIPTASVAKICSGQVILDLSTAVKELVENALDAGATSVEIKLKEHGLQLIEVADNGKGVPPGDHAALALKYHTSKINQFQDLEALHTFGFRGEALSSLSALGELSVITRTADQAAATRLEFDRDGRLTSSSAVARAVGTTVVVKDLFGALPVRRQEFARNVRREVAKLKLLLQQYAIMTTQVQLFASDQAGKAARTVLVSTSNAGSSLSDRVAAVLGSKVAAVLEPLQIHMQEEGVTIKGMVSRAGCGVKGEKLRQFCCVNSRPVELPRAVKVLNDTYKSLYSSLVGTRPMAFLAFDLPAGTFDVNVTPDKRSVFIQKEVAIMNALGQALQALWEPSRYSYAVNQTEAFDQRRAARSPAALADAELDEEDAREGVRTNRSRRRSAAGQQQQQQQSDSAAEVEAAEADAGDDAMQAQVGDVVTVAEPLMAQPEDTGGPAAAAAVRGRRGSGIGGAAAATTAAAGPPSLTSFMIGRQTSQAASSQPSQQQKLLQRQTLAAVEGTAAAGSSAEAGQKRLRPLEAALMGNKAARTRSGGSTPASAMATAAATGAETEDTEEPTEPGPTDEAAAGVQTAAAADGSIDVSDSEGADEADTECHSQQQQHELKQHELQQQQHMPPPLSAFQLCSTTTSSGPDSELLAGAGAEDNTDAGGQAMQRGRQPKSDRGQKSLAACGFQVLPAAAQQQQQRDSTTKAEGQQPGQQHEQQQQEEKKEERERKQQHTMASENHAQPVHDADGAAAAAAAAAVDGDGATAAEDSVSDDEPIVVVQFERAPVPDQAAAAAVVASGRVPGAEHGGGLPEQQQHVPIVLDYSMQQLLADMQLRMQQMQTNQQQQLQAKQAADSCRLAAASLQDASLSSEHQDVSATAAAAAAGGAASDDAATAELTRVFNKADFAVMQPVGQFNLGFIIARLRQDLFIVDQHAADEKSTYERLMGSYRANKQPLLQPRRLSTITPMDQQMIRQHMSVFQRNGFEFAEQAPQQQQQQQRPRWQGQPWSATGAAAAAASGGSNSSRSGGAAEGQIEASAAAGDTDDANHDPEAAAALGESELLLSAVPVVRGANGGGVLGEEALLELLDLLAAGERRPEDIRPKRVCDMLASRACRTSIMIGSPLTRQQQGRILTRLAELEAPFNCPHGRPTMRHLAVLPE